MLENVQNLLQIRTPADFVVAFLDIAIVSYLIYRVLLLIRGTKAFPILLGLVLVTISFFVSKDEYMGLSTLNWVLEKFIAAFILLVIVIFQDDIRRGLAEVGRSRLFRGAEAVVETHVIEEIVRACGAMSSRRIGALIAIERSGDLSMYAEEGIRVEGRVSQELLFSIFNPANANPTHDGAVIVQNGRVMSAGCFLPLTANPRVSKKFGTRHRAAIGLSEETDAVICVVSEETGVVSVFFQETVARDLDANTLRERLQSLLSFSEVGTTKDRSGRTLLRSLRTPVSTQVRKEPTE